MLKKIILSFIFVIFVYILSCAWAMDWIDNQKIESQFFSKKQKSITTLNITKAIWQITPAFNREKDAERALKISQLYIDYLTVNHNKEEMIKSLEENYDFISSYYNKNENKISDKLRTNILSHRFGMINRLLGDIKRIDLSLKHFFETSIPKGMQSELEYMWFYYFVANYEKGYTGYWNRFINSTQQSNIKGNTTKYNIVAEYHLALRLCYDKYLSRKNAEENNIESQKIFQQLQEKMKPERDYIGLSSYLKYKHASTLFLIPLISSNQTECEKEAKNFADKMVELANQ